MLASSKQIKPKFRVVGFTGTESGATLRQRKRLDQIFTILNPRKLAHGSCIGADVQAHRIAVNHNVSIEIFPCDIIHKQVKLDAAHTHPIKRPLTRNRDIVAISDILLATPLEFSEIDRSGTWATIRYARQAGIPIVIIFPDGTLKIEGSVPQLSKLT